MLRYILSFIIYFGGTFLLAELDIWRKNNKEKQYEQKRAKRKFEKNEELNKIGFLMRLRGEI